MPRTSRIPLEVVMVPLKSHREIRPPNFPRYPRLYAELLQNTDKISPEFLRQEFVPTYPQTEVIFDDDGDDMSNEKHSFSSQAPKKEERKDPKKEERKEVKKEERKEVKKEERKEVKKEDPKKEEVKKEDHEEPLPDDLFEAPPPSHPVDENDPVASFLKKSRSIGSRPRPEGRKENVQRDKNEVLRDERKIPPSLAELEDGGAFENKNGPKDLNRISRKDQDQEQRLRELLFKYELLRKAHPNDEIPRFTIHSDPENVARTYDDILRNLSLTDNITKYKKYLMFGFMGVEALGGNILGFDMKGFTKQQIAEMGSYEKLLIELGEKNYVPKSNWPVELRLLGIIVMNAAFFVASKMALKATGTDVLGVMNTTANAGVSLANQQQRKKPKMNGPSINLDDIPILEETKSNPPTTNPPPGLQFVS